MANIRLSFFAAILAVCLSEIYGAGKDCVEMVIPLDRATQASEYFDLPNVPTANNCGGKIVQYEQNGGKCGPCGDNYQDPVPRANENGGIYHLGPIIREFKEGKTIKAAVRINITHPGHFEFNICKLRAHEKDVETEECFDKYPLKFIDDDNEITDKYYVRRPYGLFTPEVLLPNGLKCEHCVLRWQYKTCEGGNRQGQGCAANPEVFRTCSGVIIKGEAPWEFKDKPSWW